MTAVIFAALSVPFHLALEHGHEHPHHHPHPHHHGHPHETASHHKPVDAADDVTGHAHSFPAPSGSHDHNLSEQRLTNRVRHQVHLDHPDALCVEEANTHLPHQAASPAPRGDLLALVHVPPKSRPALRAPPHC